MSLCFRPIYIEATQDEVNLITTLVTPYLQEGCVVIDIGTYKGGSAVMLGKLVKGYGKVFTIDHHTRDSDAVRHRLDEEDLLETVTQRLEGSVLCAEKFANESVDFIYVDDGHEYSNVMRDLTSWYPKLKRGGMICGHDCHGRFLEDYSEEQKTILIQTKNNVYLDGGKCLPNWEQEDLTWWGFPRVHSGVIVAVNDFFKGDYIQYRGTSIFSHVRG